MQDLLVGSTGFVGGNLKSKHLFEGACHSSDVEKYYNSNPELCVYAGVPAAMFLANNNPDADLEIMKQARDNIRKINPQKLVLISSIAVYRDSRGKDETSDMPTEGLSAYGKNRLLLEKWVRDDWADAIIVRLPALYGVGLKKNFLFDLHTIIPSMLKPEKYNELTNLTSLVQEGYILNENGFYCLREDADKTKMKSFFDSNDFNALSFTDSRSRYQFYGLERLWSDIKIAITNEIQILNISTPPVTAGKVYEYVSGGRRWINELSRQPFDYDMRTEHYTLFNGTDGYICTIEEELQGIMSFMSTWKDG